VDLFGWGERLRRGSYVEGYFLGVICHRVKGIP